MADKAKEDKIDNFIRITDVDRDRARFYLESSGWNLEVRFKLKLHSMRGFGS